MKKINICITGDLLRPADNGVNTSRQNNNIQRIFEILRYPIESCSSNIRLQPIYGGPGNFDVWDAYQSLGLSTSMENWVHSFNIEEVPEEFLNYIALTFSGYDLVICFEINNLMKKSFEKIGIKYVDILIHPVRFLDDVMFSFYSNDDDIHEYISKFTIPESLFYREAGLIKASRVDKKVKAPPKASIIFFGQTDDDKVLIQNKKLVNFSDYNAKITSLLHDSEHIGFKPHPYASSDFGILEICHPFRKIHMVKDNFYHLVCSNFVDKIISVTSSVSIEAKYFNKEAIHLGEYPWKFRTDSEKSREAYIPIRHEYFFEAFWQGVILRNPGSSLKEGFYSPNKIRIALGNFWGFNEISTDFIVNLAKK